jgi:putative ABC transport system permease protein
MLKLSLNSIWGRKRRLLRTAVAVTVGVAFLSGTLVLGDTLTANFRDLFTDVSAGTDVVVRSATTVAPGAEIDGDRGLVDASLLDVVRAVPGVATAEAQVTGYGSLIGADGDAIGGNGPPRLASSWVTTAVLNPYRLVEGRPPEAPDEVVINRGAALAGGLEVGDVTDLQTPDPVAVAVVGVATFGDTDGLGETTFAAFTLAGAQANVTREPDGVSTVLVEAAPGTTSDDLRDRIAEALPGGVEAITGDQLAEERIAAISDEFLGMLKTFLTAFAVIALFVAALTISNAFAITLTQRTGELALLRAVGASRRQLRRIVTMEAALIGAVSGVVGMVAGLGIAGLLKGVFDAFGGALPAGGLVVRPGTVALAVAVGVGIAIAAAQLPARHASMVSPVTALRGDTTRSARQGTARSLAGAVLLATGSAGAIVAASAGSVALVGLAAPALVAATLLLAPTALPPVARAIGVPLGRLLGADARLAERNTRRDPRRSAATATALVVGVAVVSLFTVFAASMKTSLDGQVGIGFSADLAVNTAAFGGGRLSPRATEELARLPEIDEAVAIGGGFALLGGETTEITSTDTTTIDAVLAIDATEGSLDDVGENGMAISAAMSKDRSWGVGTPVAVTFSDGTHGTLTVQAIYEDNAILGGVVVDDALWAAHTTQPTNRTVFLAAGDDVSPSRARQAVTPIAIRYGGDVQDRAEYSAATTGGLDVLLGVVYVLLALAVFIALVGIANALSLAVHERRREIGLLRAVGQTRRQARSVVRLEAVIVAAFGTVTGVVLGAVLGWALFSAVSDSPGFTLPVARLGVVMLLGAAAGALAARRPARQAARQPILEAIAAP